MDSGLSYQLCTSLRIDILREHALIESVVSSNRIEGVTVDVRRIKAVVLALPAHRGDMVRTVLRNLQKAGKVECLGRGPGASWRIK